MSTRTIAACPTLFLPLMLSLALLGCSSGPDVEGLKSSFAQQIESIDLVQDFVRQGDDISFVRPDGSGELIEWRVEIDSAVIEAPSDDSQSYRGIVTSSWLLNDRPITTRGDVSNLPIWVLETGLSQDCWALWENESGQWGWT